MKPRPLEAQLGAGSCAAARGGGGGIANVAATPVAGIRGRPCLFGVGRFFETASSPSPSLSLPQLAAEPGPLTTAEKQLEHRPKPMWVLGCFRQRRLAVGPFTVGSKLSAGRGEKRPDDGLALALEPDGAGILAAPTTLLGVDAPSNSPRDAGLMEESPLC